ncbi:MAG: beta-ketoacyl-ACP synthase II [Bacteroidales bacterium]|nr:beta-ketoacyl-ACP synthase II [Bacteroidales bacterium]
MTQRRVVVTGYGALTPLGNTADETWENVTKGVSGTNEITRFDTTKFKTHIACELKDYNPLNYFDKKEVRKYNLFQQYALVASDEAVKKSKIVIDKLDRSRCGVIWGSAIGGLETLMVEISDFNTGDGTPRFSPNLFTKIMFDSVPGMIAQKYKFEGPSYVTVSGCASSSNAIINAYRKIAYNVADLFIVGGSEAPISPIGIGAFSAMKSLSTRNDDYATASRPFDTDRDGFVIGEGAGALVIESLDHAVARNATIYAEIVGTGYSNDNVNTTNPDPKGESAYNAMKSAIASAGMDISDINHINAHASGTKDGDLSETRAIRNLFGDALPKIYVTSTKSMTGHLLGASGAVESVISILSLCDAIVPPTINNTSVDPEIGEGFYFILNKAKKRKINCVMNNSFGLGGHNAVIIFKKFK